VYLTGKIDLTLKKRRPNERGPLKYEPLAEVRFVRTRHRVWYAVVQRYARATPAADRWVEERRAKGMSEERQSLFIDPGIVKAFTGYAPNKAEIITYLPKEPVVHREGGGGGGGQAQGADRLVEVIHKAVDAKLKMKEIKREGREYYRRHAKKYKRLRRREQRYFAKATSLMRDATRRIAHHMCSQFTDIYIAHMHTAQKVKKPEGEDERRWLNKQATEKLLALSHYKFRCYLKHRGNITGAKIYVVEEHYTTIGCPYCGRVQDECEGRLFYCPQCRYTADRDDKAGLTLALKLADV
jgi:Putative transposase DNA-binding domain